VGLLTANSGSHWTWLLKQFVCVCVAAMHKQIRECVMMGQRPDLNAVTGPEMPVTLIKDCISRCWHQLSECRPTFAGRYQLHYVTPLWT